MIAIQVLDKLGPSAFQHKENPDGTIAGVDEYRLHEATASQLTPTMRLFCRLTDDGTGSETARAGRPLCISLGAGATVAAIATQVELLTGSSAAYQQIMFKEDPLPKNKKVGRWVGAVIVSLVSLVSLFSLLSLLSRREAPT